MGTSEMRAFGLFVTIAVLGAVCSASVLSPAKKAEPAAAMHAAAVHHQLQPASISFMELPPAPELAEETAAAGKGTENVDVGRLLKLTHGCTHGSAGAVEPTSKVSDGSVVIQFRDQSAKGHLEWKLVGKQTQYTKFQDICNVEPGQYVLLTRVTGKGWVMLADSFGKNGVLSTNQTIPVTAHTTTVVTIEHVRRMYVDQVEKPATVTVELPPLVVEDPAEKSTPIHAFAVTTVDPQAAESTTPANDRWISGSNCKWKGPGRGISNLGGSHLPDTGVDAATVEDCAKECDSRPDCKGFHWYGKESKQSTPYLCYMHTAAKLLSYATCVTNANPSLLKAYSGSYGGVCSHGSAFPSDAEKTSPKVEDTASKVEETKVEDSPAATTPKLLETNTTPKPKVEVSEAKKLVKVSALTGDWKSYLKNLDFKEAEKQCIALDGCIGMFQSNLRQYHFVFAGTGQYTAANAPNGVWSIDSPEPQVKVTPVIETGAKKLVKVSALTGNWKSYSKNIDVEEAEKQCIALDGCIGMFQSNLRQYHFVFAGTGQYTAANAPNGVWSFSG